MTRLGALLYLVFLLGSATALLLAHEATSLLDGAALDLAAIGLAALALHVWAVERRSFRAR